MLDITQTTAHWTLQESRLLERAKEWLLFSTFLAAAPRHCMETLSTSTISLELSVMEAGIWLRSTLWEPQLWTENIIEKY